MKINFHFNQYLNFTNSFFSLVVANATHKIVQQRHEIRNICVSHDREILQIKKEYTDCEGTAVTEIRSLKAQLVDNQEKTNNLAREVQLLRKRWQQSQASLALHAEEKDRLIAMLTEKENVIRSMCCEQRIEVASLSMEQQHKSQVLDPNNKKTALSLNIL